ncbi:MAG: mycothiol system anti-sigma-R factor [Gemmatimonadetes bacterium]|jgi:anti-sigma factor (TIGR02949 family)|nr:MAG: mycothiol system anti-sigma-R factor [Gemmatimonadota bacterium]
MNCRECKDQLYEYLDRELTPAVEQEIRQHIADCPPCGEEFDFEKLFLGFLKARCRAQGAPADLKRRILDELLDE